MSERMRTMLRLAEDEVADMLRARTRRSPAGSATPSVPSGRSRKGARREAADILGRARAEARGRLSPGPRSPGRGRGGRGGGPRVDRRGARPPPHARSHCRPRSAEQERTLGLGGVGAPAHHGRGRLLHRDGPAPRRGADGDPGRAGAHRSSGCSTARTRPPGRRAPRSPRPRRPPAG